MVAMRFERIHFIIFSTAVILFLILTFSNYGFAPLVNNVHSLSSSKQRPGHPLNLEQRMNRSEASWQRHVHDRERSRSHLPASAVWKFWETQGGSGDDGWLTIWDFFIPAYTCPWDNERVGRFGDGGKWICGMSRYSAYEEERALVVYSFGVRDDSSFEEEMLTNTNCEIVAVDFSVDSFGDQLTAGHRNRSTFMKVGLGAKDEPFKDPPFYTLKTLMEKHAHDYIDVLKVDIEGGEFDSITRFMDDYEGEDLPIGQLVMELHLDDPIRWDFYKVYAFMERLESFGLRITAYELNMGSLSRGPPKYNEYAWVNTRNEKNILWHE